MIDIDELRERLVGMQLPEGQYRVLDFQSWLHADALGSPTLPEGVLHPMWVFNAALSGAGITVDGLFALADITMDDGPMGGEMEMRQVRPLRVGEALTVRATITDIERKQGRSGIFDRMTSEATISDEADEVVGVVTNVYIFPRRA